MQELSNRVALVTGGASGIGLAIARSLAAAGMRVAIGDIDETALERAAAELRSEGATILPLILDVGDAASWARAAAEIEHSLGPVQVLCNNAGVGPGRSKVEDLSPEDWNWTLQINLTGVFLGTRTFVPRLVSGGLEGHVVNTASILGLFPTPFHAAYVTSKFAVVGLSEVMRMELAPKRIGVSVLCPGLVRTRLRANSLSRRPSRPEARPPVAVAAEPGPDRPLGIAPETVGPFVLSAIRDSRFYVITHPEYGGVIENRMQRLIDACATNREDGYIEDIAVLGGASLALRV
ncbi:MAG TPA: SDR family NAD(P)-dependent oxidoreductase [Paracoccaceae bacterium]|nr:SDR family NAD(P)-dependent oxidoreductase [Paracoccaceae bacterium]